MTVARLLAVSLGFVSSIGRTVARSLEIDSGDGENDEQNRSPNP